MNTSSGYGTPLAEDEAVRLLHHAVDSGLTLIDTSDYYAGGVNERIVAKLLRERRSEVFLCSKFGIVAIKDGVWHVRGDAEYVKKCCNDSLERLGVECIDLYYQHRLDPKVPIEETVTAMAELVKEGKVKYLGLSEASPDPAIIRRAHAVHPITALQVEYSAWVTDIEKNGVLDVCRELGIAIVAYCPLGRGFLTGSVRSAGMFPDGDMRRDLPRFQGENLEKNLSLVDALERMANEKQCTVGQLSLAWLMHQSRPGAPVIPIPGTKRAERVDENAGALRIQFTDEDDKRLRDIVGAVAVVGDRYASLQKQ
ncbi:hypothetical protein HK405_004649 [Cladochytrium tenue]|nr:hypothetical protein HK405_004649 [Cladochytrium tenue]